MIILHMLTYNRTWRWPLSVALLGMGAWWARSHRRPSHKAV